MGTKKRLHLRLSHLGTNQYMLVAGQEKATQAIAGPHATQRHQNPRPGGIGNFFSNGPFSGEAWKLIKMNDS